MSNCISWFHVNVITYLLHELKVGLVNPFATLGVVGQCIDLLCVGWGTSWWPERVYMTPEWYEKLSHMPEQIHMAKWWITVSPIKIHWWYHSLLSIYQCVFLFMPTPTLLFTCQHILLSMIYVFFLPWRTFIRIQYHPSIHPQRWDS